MFKLQSFLIYFFICSSFCSFSQRKFKRFNLVDGFSIIPKIGFSSVLGELGYIYSIKPVFEGNIEKGISERINIGVQIIGGTLAGSENQTYFSRFESNFFQIQTVGIVNISKYLNDSHEKNNLEFKLYAGLGLIWFHTDVFDIKSGAFLRTTADGNTKHTAYFQKSGNGIGDAGIYYTRESVIPFGFRVDSKVNDNLGFMFNLGYNWVYNDKLDGTTPYNLINPNIIGGVNSYSDTANDGWINLSVGLKYTFSLNRTENQRGV